MSPTKTEELLADVQAGEIQAFEELTDEEAYLAAILLDPSGLDLAEFCWADNEGPDGIFRAWPFQWPWWRCNDPLQIDQCARSVGKTLSIKVRLFSFPFAHSQQEAVITAPELVHLEPITDLVETVFETCRLGREIRPRGRSATTHRPFMMNFLNGARIIGRIPQKDGKGVKGIHPIWLEMDEAQDYPERGWLELTETLQMGKEGAVWRAHGVTRGVRDKFFEFTQETPDNDWTVHRVTAMHRPIWTEGEREAKIKMYGGSRHSPDYRRNILGLHGDATNPLFVLHRLMKCVDKDQSSDYNTDEYYHIEIRAEEVEDRGLDILQFLNFPEMHTKRYDVFWGGMDVGYTHDPSEILIFAEYHPSAEELREQSKRDRDPQKDLTLAAPVNGKSRLKLVTRISLYRIEAPEQVRVLLYLMGHYKCRSFAMDKTGNGLPLYQDINAAMKEKAQESAAIRDVAERIRGYDFSEKVLVDIDELEAEGKESDTDEKFEEIVKEAGIKKNVLEYSTDKLREYVDDGRLLLPWDVNLIKEFQGQTFSYSKAAIDSYGRRRRIFSEGSFHALDGARMAAMGHAQAPIEGLVEQDRKSAPVLDRFIM